MIGSMEDEVIPLKHKGVLKTKMVSGANYINKRLGLNANIKI